MTSYKSRRATLCNNGMHAEGTMALLGAVTVYTGLLLKQEVDCSETNLA